MNNQESGFTLIELLISMAIVTLVIGAIVIFQRDLFSINSFLEQALLIQRDSETVIKNMVAEIRSASQSNAGGYPLEITASTSLAFYANIDKDPLKERVHYFLDGVSLKKSVVKPVGNPLTYSTTTAQETVLTVLRDIVTTATSSLFNYYDKNYAGTTTPLMQPISILAVRLIGIVITVDADPNRLPPPITVSSQVAIRGLKDNL